MNSKRIAVIGNLLSFWGVALFVFGTALSGAGMPALTNVFQLTSHTNSNRLISSPFISGDGNKIAWVEELMDKQAELCFGDLAGMMDLGQQAVLISQHQVLTSGDTQLRRAGLYIHGMSQDGASLLFSRFQTGADRGNPPDGLYLANTLTQSTRKIEPSVADPRITNPASLAPLLHYSDTAALSGDGKWVFFLSEGAWGYRVVGDGQVGLLPGGSLSYAVVQ